MDTIGKVNAIGGYFGLELPVGGEIPYPDAYRYQSARAALCALIANSTFKKIWIPFFICDAVVAALKMADVDYGFYSINFSFEVDSSLEIQDDECILYPNYFGLCRARQLDLLRRFAPAQVIFDNSQAFFCDPLDCLGTIYSPRKFFGVPDGGILVTNVNIPRPEIVDSGSIDRMSHLLIRLGGEAESGYAAYLASENTLTDVTPRSMSGLTEGLLRSIDRDSIREKRSKNFRFLHAHLESLNDLHIDQAAVDGPLCYPFLSQLGGMREALMKRRVYVARYWPEVLMRVGCGEVEEILANFCLPLPCDQRYSEPDLLRIIEIIKAG